MPGNWKWERKPTMPLAAHRTLYNFIREEQSLDLIMISRLQARVITSWLAHRITVLLYSEEHAADFTMRLLGQCMLLVFVLVANIIKSSYFFFYKL